MKFTSSEQMEHLGRGHFDYGNVFSLFQMLRVGMHDAASNEGVAYIGACPGIGTDRHEVIPFTSRIARFLQEFALGGMEGFFPFFNDACRQFPSNELPSVTVLPFQEHISFVREGNDVDPIRIFQHIVILHLHAAWQTNMVASGSHPRTADEVFTAE